MEEEEEVPKLYYTVEVKLSDGYSELDFTLDDEILPEYDYKTMERDSITIGEPTTDGFPIAIDTLIAKLNEFKQAGCNYVSIEHHGDHIGYDLDGLHVYRSTSEQLKTRMEQQEKIKELIEKKKKLYDELRKLDD